MVEAALISKNGTFLPYSKEDEQAIKDYAGQMVKAKISGVRNPRSYQQLKAYFACCRAVAENTENPDFNTKDKVDLQLRIKLGWIKETVLVNKRVQFIPKSISYKEMKHLTACNYFSEAFQIMADFLKCTVDELLKCAE